MRNMINIIWLLSGDENYLVCMIHRWHEHKIYVINLVLCYRRMLIICSLSSYEQVCTGMILRNTEKFTGQTLFSDAHDIPRNGLKFYQHFQSCFQREFSQPLTSVSKPFTCFKLKHAYIHNYMVTELSIFSALTHQQSPSCNHTARRELWSDTLKSCWQVPPQDHTSCIQETEQYIQHFPRVSE